MVTLAFLWPNLHTQCTPATLTHTHKHPPPTTTTTPTAPWKRKIDPKWAVQLLLGNRLNHIFWIIGELGGNQERWEDSLTLEKICNCGRVWSAVHYLHANEGDGGNNTLAKEKKKIYIYIYMWHCCQLLRDLCRATFCSFICAVSVCVCFFLLHLISPRVEWKYIHFG